MGLKITLDEASSEAMQSMVCKIKAESSECAVTISSLASWIVVHFADKSFAKLKDAITDHHFNAKAFLRNRLKDLDSPEKVEAALLEVRSKMKSAIDVGLRTPPRQIRRVKVAKSSESQSEGKSVLGF